MQVSEVHAKGNAIVYAVQSKFKQPGGPSRTIIVTLFSRRTGNSFYDKHVLREGESSRSVWDERKGALNNAGFDPVKMASANAKGIYTGSNRSTFIRLKNIAVHSMVYSLAKAMLENYLQNAWLGGVGSYNPHLPSEVVFNEVNSVVSYDSAGNKHHARSLVVGAKFESMVGNTLSFDLNHCGGHGAT